MKHSKRVLLLGTFVFAVAAIFLFFGKNNENAAPKTEKISDAYEAMLMRADAQTYPSGHIPKNAHFAAWEQAKSLKNEFESGNNTAPWRAVGPLNRGGRTLALAFNPQNSNTLYAGSASGGLWRSYTAGEGVKAWHQVPIDFPILGVSCIAFPEGDSSVMYIGTGEVYNIAGAGTGAAYRATRGSVGMGILKSTDGGATWSKSLDWTANQEHGIWQIKIDPTNSNVVLANTTDGLYKSTDAGSTWTNILDVKMGTDVLIHPTNSDTILACFGNLGSAGWGVYRSADGGQNWTHLLANFPVGFQGKIQMNYAPSNPNVVYASCGNGFSTATGATRLMRSEDFGLTWTEVSDVDYSIFQGWFAHDIAPSPLDENRLAIIGVECWFSNDGGSTIEKITVGGVGPNNPPIGGQSAEPNYVHSDSHDVIWHPTEPNTFYIASDGGINRTQDGGQTFEILTGGYQTAQFYNGCSASPTDSTFFLGGLQDNGTNRWNGDSTFRIEFGGDGSYSAVDPFNSDVRYFSYQNLNIYKRSSNDFFYLNVLPINPVAFIAPYVLSPLDGNTMYAGSAGISKSTDAGESFTQMNNGQALDGNPCFSMEIAAMNPDVLYVGTAPAYPFNGSRGHVFTTRDGGQTFTDVTGNLPDRFPMDITTDPTDDATAYVTFSGFGTGHLFRTTDFGANWDDISGDLPDVPTNAVIVDPLNPTHIYVGNDLGVYASTDNGLTWFSYMDGFPTAAMAFDLKISQHNRKLWVGTHGNGAYQRDLLPSGFVAEKSPVSNRVEAKVFPNPISFNSKISFSLKNQSSVQLRLLDLQGKLVGNISLGKRNQGEHIIQWPFEKTKVEGLYYVQIISKEGTSTLKVHI